MLHSLRLFCFLLITTLTAQAQVSIGSLTPAPGAQLDVVATDKGILIPRVTSTAAVTATSEGLLVYQTSAPAGFYVRKAGSWVRLATTEDTLGTLIQYASGQEIFISGSILAPMSDQLAVLGFGNSYGFASGSLSGVDPRLNGLSSSISRAGTLTSISACFVSSGATSANSIKAQVYTDFGTGNVFSAIPGAEVSFLLPNGSPVGTIIRGITTGLNIPIAAQSRLLLVFSCSSNDFTFKTAIGYASAGITIK